MSDTGRLGHEGSNFTPIAASLEALLRFDALALSSRRRFLPGFDLCLCFDFLDSLLRRRCLLPRRSLPEPLSESLADGLASRRASSCRLCG